MRRFPPLRVHTTYTGSLETAVVHVGAVTSMQGVVVGRSRGEEHIHRQYQQGFATWW